MAITNTEFQISNKSYTNKDFESIYNELLDIATKLSLRFSPATSNEADPFVILLKLAAFVADKTNYNVDKNILERFMISCTQEKSMRDLTEMLGYAMHYYIAAKTDVIFKYQFKENDESDIIIPQYSTLKNYAGNIEYITLNQTIIARSTGLSTKVSAIQGIVKTLSVLGNTMIQLDNLDSNRRIYFPETSVAENGILITGGSSNISLDWTISDNLNLDRYNTCCYKLGFDSIKNLPYLEFPQWISNIIGDGLTIKYIVTDGINGNISAKELVNVVRYGIDKNTDTINDDKIIVINSNAANNGQNPETIDEAYQGFKKVIGTFDTLITCRDFANAIYSMLNDNGKPYVSNIQVADRRTDINNACNVATFSEYGKQTISVVKKVDNKDKISAFDLQLYPLNPLYNTSYYAIRDNIDNNYESSYKLLINTNDFKFKLDDCKCLSHNYKELATNDIINITNCYKIEAILTTTTKVTSAEELDISNKVKEALIKAYNPRTLEFGSEILFDSIVKTIKNADARIKDVSLYEPIQTPSINVRNNNETVNKKLDYTETNNPYKKIVNNNILAGRVSLFDYDEDFKYTFDQKASTKVDTNDAELKLSTYSNIESISANSEYKLLDNEVIEFIAPSLITSCVYPVGINYILTLNSSKDHIAKDAEYQLQANESLRLQYQDADTEQWQNITLNAGEIIKPNFDFYTNSYKVNKGDTPYHKVGINSSLNWFTLLTKEEIHHRTINKETITTAKKCYWIMNNNENSINWDSNNEYVLEDGEYFFYSDVLGTEMFSYSYGTKLKITAALKAQSWSISKSVDIESLAENGISSFINYFNDIAFTSINPLTILEQQIITLVTGDVIKNNNNSALMLPDNTINTLGTNNIQYKFAADDSYINLTDLTSLSSDYAWKVRVSVDINSGPETEQKLVGKQTAKYQIGTNTPVVIANGSTFKISELIQQHGGTNIDLSYIGLDLDTHYPKLLYYTSDVLSTLEIFDTNYYIVKGTTTVNLLSGVKKCVMIRTSNTSTSNYLTVSTTVGSGFRVINKNVGTTLVKTLTIKANELNILEIDSTTTNITLTLTGSVGCIISDERVINGTNSLLYPNADYNVILNDIYSDNSEALANFNIINYIDAAKEIILSKSYPLYSAQAFYDVNNIANNWVLSKIDFNNCTIAVSRNCKI